MKLVAIYIREHQLTHIFGEHDGITINLGGKYFYTLNSKGIVSKKENINYIANFYGNDIELISAIVGANGTGKSTILNIFRDLDNYELIFENIEGNLITNPRISERQNILFYSPFLEIKNYNGGESDFYDLSLYRTMLYDTNNENGEFQTLLELYDSENLKRWIKFISEFNPFLKEIRLPVFDKIKIKINTISVDNHDTSFGFRKYFEYFDELYLDNFELKRMLELKHSDSEKQENRNYGNSLMLKLFLIRSVIRKVHNILERSGNKYLEEGRVNDLIKNNEFLKKSLKDAFYQFLDVAYISLPKTKEIKLPIQQIKNLIEVLIESLPEDEEIDNWSEFETDFVHGNKIIDAYKEFILSFKDDFTYETRILLTFSPYINLSSGERAMYNLFSMMYDIKYKLDNRIFDNDFFAHQEPSNNFLLLLDEADLGFHPTWKKKFVSSLVKIIPEIFKDHKIQILFTTHDPHTLSDIPKQNVVFLDKNKETNNTEVLTHLTNKQKTFGVNIHDLLANSFFLKDGFMGEYAESVIKDLINYLTYNPRIDKRNFPKMSWSQEKAKKVIHTIDEPFIKTKVQELYIKKFYDSEKQILLQKIEEINVQIKELDEKNKDH